MGCGWSASSKALLGKCGKHVEESLGTSWRCASREARPERARPGPHNSLEGHKALQSSGWDTFRSWMELQSSILVIVISKQTGTAGMRYFGFD